MATIAKVNGRGTVWTSYYIAYGTLAYKMEREGSTQNRYSTIDHIEVRPAATGGWDVVLYGDPVYNCRHKNEAQREAEKLLDNPRDASGWLVQNTGRM